MDQGVASVGTGCLVGQPAGSRRAGDNGVNASQADLAQVVTLSG